MLLAPHRVTHPEPCFEGQALALIGVSIVYILRVEVLISYFLPRRFHHAQDFESDRAPMRKYT